MTPFIQSCFACPHNASRRQQAQTPVTVARGSDSDCVEYLLAAFAADEALHVSLSDLGAFAG